MWGRGGITRWRVGGVAAERASGQSVRMGVVNGNDVIATSGMDDVLLTGLGDESKQTGAVQQIIFA
ncbi:glycine/betaine ABC transporter substrate-binding protein, partial [Pseudomonas ogarae]